MHLKITDLFYFGTIGSESVPDCEVSCTTQLEWRSRKRMHSLLLKHSNQSDTCREGPVDIGNAFQDHGAILS